MWRQCPRVSPCPLILSQPQRLHRTEHADTRVPSAGSSTNATRRLQDARVHVQRAAGTGGLRSVGWLSHTASRQPAAPVCA